MLKLSIALISKWEMLGSNKKTMNNIYDKDKYIKKAAGDFDTSALREEGNVLKKVMKTKHCLNIYKGVWICIVILIQIT